MADSGSGKMSREEKTVYDDEKKREMGGDGKVISLVGDEDDDDDDDEDEDDDDEDDDNMDDSLRVKSGKKLEQKKRKGPKFEWTDERLKHLVLSANKFQCHLNRSWKNGRK
jgi:hypothetical protein